MEFNPKRVSFGRHETFALRYSWLTKGYQALEKHGSDVFSSDKATVTLGVGRNMVNAIRYWLLAARLIEAVPEGHGLRPTNLGGKIFGDKGFDPYLEDEATLWLIHWLIATNSKQATSWYWFFNYFHKAEFTAVEAEASLFDFVKQKIGSKPSENTVKKDASIVLRMYARSKEKNRIPSEEALDSPLSLLSLVSHAGSGRTYFSCPAERKALPIGIFGFAVAELFLAMDVRELPIQDLMYAKNAYPSLGAVFRLTENALITKIEKMIHLFPGIFEMRETAGIHQLYLLEKVESMQFLEAHYIEQCEAEAA